MGLSQVELSCSFSSQDLVYCRPTNNFLWGLGDQGLSSDLDIFSAPLSRGFLVVSISLVKNWTITNPPELYTCIFHTHSLILVLQSRSLPAVFSSWDIFRHARVSSTYPCMSVRPSVRPSVRDTFGFPLPLNVSVQQSSLMSISYFIEIVYFLKVYFPKVYFLKVYFPKVYFLKVYFPKVYFSKVYFSKVYFF